MSKKRGRQEKVTVSFIRPGRIHFNPACTSEADGTINYEISVLWRQTIGKTIKSFVLKCCLHLIKKC